MRDPAQPGVQVLHQLWRQGIIRNKVAGQEPRIPDALADGTQIDPVLGRLAGLRLGDLSDGEMSKLQL